VSAHVWHVDVYHGSLDGLVTAEVELSHEAEKFARPSWLGTEVSQDKTYSNKNLARAGRIPLRRVA
jgi:adenylate cyclase